MLPVGCRELSLVGHVPAFSPCFSRIYLQQYLLPGTWYIFIPMIDLQYLYSLTRLYILEYVYTPYPRYPARSNLSVTPVSSSASVPRSLACLLAMMSFDEKVLSHRRYSSNSFVLECLQHFFVF